MSKRCSNLYKNLENLSSVVFRTKSNIYDGAFSAKITQIYGMIVNMPLESSLVYSLWVHFGRQTKLPKYNTALFKACK